MHDPKADYENVGDHIIRFEQLSQEHAPSKATISRYQVLLDGISSHYDYDTSLNFLYCAFYELQALIYIAEKNSTKAIAFLKEAADIKPSDMNFISVTAEDWYEKKQERSHASSNEAYRKTVGKKRFGKKTRIFLWGTLGVVILLVAFSGPISDNLTISNANPTMIKLAQDAGMTRKGELIFLRTNPQLVNDTQMAQYCPDAQTNNDGFIEQGCFVPNQSDPTTGNIYIRQMSSDLYSLEVTTAAYEMLHPAYIGLAEGSDSGAALNKSIEANQSALSDADMVAQIANFAKTEPSARDLELFSILGTEYSGISDDLAAYYTPYISNISTDVSLNNQVNQLFQSDETQLNSLNSTINTLDSQANTAYKDSVSWADVGNQYQDDRNYNIYQQDFNTENTDIDQYNTLLDQYNVLVDEYNGQQFTPDSQPQAQSQ
jgi:hypothetical protein